MLIKYQFRPTAIHLVKGVQVTPRVLGGIKGEQLEVTVDGERVKLFDWDKEIQNTTGNGKATPRIPIKAGLHTVGVTFLATNDLPATELNRPFQRTMNTPGSIPGFMFYPHVGQVWIEGPYDAKGAADTDSRRKIFVCRPASAREEGACADRIISRRSPSMRSGAPRIPRTESLTKFYLAARNEAAASMRASRRRSSASSRSGIVYARAGLRSRRRQELSRSATSRSPPGCPSSCGAAFPTTRLIDLAGTRPAQGSGGLREAGAAHAGDPKSEALITNFTGQWLNVRSMKASEPVVNLFPDFDDNLRNAFQRETELFFDSIVHGSQCPRPADGGLHVRQRAAGEALRDPERVWAAVPARDAAGRARDARGCWARVRCDGDVGGRTSPVARGKWFLQTFLGVSPPDPPPDVDTSLKEKPNDPTGNAKTPTMRQTMEMHRANPTCAQCHRIFEPLGFALENFDAVGAWRTQDEGVPVDATGVIVDGTKVDGVNSLRSAGAILRPVRAS
jgi:hypothetical protein